jgi:DNA-binding NarL/FixJ family response regulator
MKQPLIFILDTNGPRGNWLMYRLRGSEFRHIETFTSEKECLYRIRTNGSPSVIIMDTGRDPAPATAFIADVKRAHPSAHIIFFTDTDYLLRTPNSDDGLKELIKNIHYLASRKVQNNRLF